MSNKIVELNINQNISNPIDTIIQSIFDLTPLQYQFFNKLRNLFYEMQDKVDGLCIQMITMKFPSERSVTQKTLKILMDKGLIERHSITLAEFNKNCVRFAQTELQKKNDKGCLFLYRPIAIDQLLSNTKTILQNWSQIIDQYSKSIEI